MFHLNISKNGVMELAILREKWSPAFDMKDILDEIKKVLKNPILELEYCIDHEAESLY
jgi:ubiquitin-protein ligase